MSSRMAHVVPVWTRGTDFGKPFATLHALFVRHNFTFSALKGNYLGLLG